MRGKHMLHHWSSTQATIALSSAEAELNAAVKAIGETLGLKHMMEEMGKQSVISVSIDSSAAKGMLSRVGCGKVKHLECRQLWVQDCVENREVQVLKVPRAVNISDAMTHHWSAADGAKHFRKAGLIWK